MSRDQVVGTDIANIELPEMLSPEKSVVEANCVHFVRALRRLGVTVTQPQLHTWLAALDHVPIDRRSLFKNSARTSLIQRPEDLAIFERLFDLFWHRDAARPRREIDLGMRLQRLAEKKEQRLAMVAPQSSDPSSLPKIEMDIHEVVLDHSDRERLRRKDFAQLTDDERRRLEQLIRRMNVPWPPRRSRRNIQAQSGKSVDLRATLRHSVSRGGEPFELRKKRPKLKPRPLVVLCDISGSMESYSRIFLQFAYSLRCTTEKLEAFVFGTRLTRITRELNHKHVDKALSEATARIIDWGGGTRIGESFRLFNQHWGRRVLGRGSVVLVVSDAWDRGDPEILGRETARIARRCSRMIWLNPLIASEGYEATASGIQAVLPHLDDFLPVHNLQSLEELAKHLERL